MSNLLRFLLNCILVVLPYEHIEANVNRNQYKTMESYMNAQIDPCDDFYEYACGNWAQVHKDADYSETISFMDYKADLEYARIIHLLKKKRRDLTREHRFIANVLDYYRSCMSIEEYTPVKYLEWFEEHENITWPSAVPKKRKSKKHYDWLHMLATLRKYDFNGVFVEQSVIQRSDNSRISIIDIDKPVQHNGFELMEYKALVMVLKDLGITDERKVQEMWNEVEFFERLLKRLDDIEDDVEEPTVETLEDLNMPWLQRYLDILLDGAVDASTHITIQNKSYFAKLFHLLDRYESEFKSRYLMIRFLLYLNVEGPVGFTKHYCIAHVRGMLPQAMHWLYETHNPQLLDEIPAIEQLFTNLVQHFTKILNENSNDFDEKIIRFLRSKLATMQIKIGNLPRNRTTEKLTEFYKNLYVNSTDFYGNHLRALRFFTIANHDLLDTLLPQGDNFFALEDSETGSSSSPYFLLRNNMVIVPWTLLQEPIYHANYENIFKYSMVGFLLAHEITHGFDDSGVHYDKLGNMRGPNADIKANELFDEHLECLRAKNEMSIDEKIADVSGLRLAYETYFSNATDATLRWSKFTAERLFFLNFAHFFCGRLNTMVASEHGSDHQRVLDTVANFAEFGRVFQCPIGSRMHPVQKCQLWR